MLFKKKALSPIVTISLFLVITTLSIISFSNWFTQYESDLETTLEYNTYDTLDRSHIDSIFGDKLYFNNLENKNISIESIKINGVSCGTSTSTLITGISIITLTTCVDDITTINSDIVILTNEGIFQKKVNADLEITPYLSLNNRFISVWNTSISGSSNSTSIELPIYNGGTYNFTVDWGDGNIENITSYTQNSHDYGTSGVYTVSITGIIGGFRFNNLGDKNKITEIQAWGPLIVGNQGEYFYGASNLDFTGTDTINLNYTTDLSWMFRGASSFNGDISTWNVSNVTNMNKMFFEATSFNQNINSWDVSSVTDMGAMFQVATSFNQPLNSWDVSKVTNMNYDGNNNDFSGMFYNATAFNQDLDQWVFNESLTNFRAMFRLASSFDGNISPWNMSYATDIVGIFFDASSFNQDISSWDISSASSLTYLFKDALSFNQPLNSLDVSNVTTMYGTFQGALSFNQSLSSWNVSSVTNMEIMFESANNYYQNLTMWDADQVTSCTNFARYTSWNSSNLKPNFTSCTE